MFFAIVWVAGAAVAHAGGLPIMQGQESTRDEIIGAARDIISAADNCALITIGPDGAPQARMMNPFPAEDDLVVWMATNPETRKVAELRADDRATLIYFDPGNPGYATLIGSIRLVGDPVERRARWKEEWADYYPGGPEGEGYLLLEFTPVRLEVVSYAHEVAADPLAWKPAIVEFERR